MPVRSVRHMTDSSPYPPLVLDKLRRGAPEVAGKIEFDSEGSMFSAIAKKEELMRDAVHDHARLRHYLETGDPDWFD